MVMIIVNWDDMVQLVGGNVDTPADMDKLISHTKSEVEAWDEQEQELKIDIKTSNRPDLACAEGISREVRGILGLERGIPCTELPSSGMKATVDAKLAKVRPYLACAVVKNAHLSDMMIRQLMQLSEKVDLSYGRNRKKTSIGMYNLGMIVFPIRYTLADAKTEFVPLGFQHPLSLTKILKKHPKGIEFGHILGEKDSYPLLTGADGEVMSMPPIINSNDVGRVTERSRDLLVEVTSSDRVAVRVVINLLAQTFLDRGATVETVEIEYLDKTETKARATMITPDFEPETMEASVKQINQYLGTSFSAKQMGKLLRKRRYDVDVNKDILIVKVPPYRGDVIHWVDLAEDVAIAADYKKIKPTTCNVVTTGALLAKTRNELNIRELLVGAGLQELNNYILTGLERLTTMFNRDPDACVLAELDNPVTSTYAVMRDMLFPSLLHFLSKNTHEPYPQRVFEVGEVVIVEIAKRAVITQTNISAAIGSPNTSFEEIHAILHRVLSITHVDHLLEAFDHTCYLPGRSANIVVDGKAVGHIGEIHPELLERWGIMVPVVGFEIEAFKIPALGIPRQKTGEY